MKASIQSEAMPVTLVFNVQSYNVEVLQTQTRILVQAGFELPALSAEAIAEAKASLSTTGFNLLMMGLDNLYTEIAQYEAYKILTEDTI